MVGNGATNKKNKLSGMAFAAGSDKLRGAFRGGVRYCDTRRETLSYAQICSRKGFQLFLLFILLFQFWGFIYG